jgi:hypothetical protein
MSLKEKISDLADELYKSINDDDLDYMEVLIEVVEKECLIDNEYLFSIYEIILEWRNTQNKPITDFVQDLCDYLTYFE